MADQSQPAHLLPLQWTGGSPPPIDRMLGLWPNPAVRSAHQQAFESWLAAGVWTENQLRRIAAK